jgi:hypothetical protein
MMVQPKDGESNTKVVEEKTYHWCNGGQDKHRPRWVMHLPSECKPRTKGATKEWAKEPPKSESKKETKETKRVGWTTGMLSLVRGAESDSDED